MEKKQIVIIMWPFKKKAGYWKPKSDFDYFMLGVLERARIKQSLREHASKRPIYTPSKIITNLK